MGEVGRRRITVEGLVQGVGFRPFVYREATTRGLRGVVRNDAAGVVIDIEGEEPALAEFVARVRTDPPPHARISSMSIEQAPPCAWPGFAIGASDLMSRRSALVSPDLATCDACLRELFDPSNRRYRYPFLNCTNCGPRLSIVDAVPYDRVRTTMTAFRMCAACRGEYEDPGDRRFHAQPNACATCGPQLTARTQAGVVIQGDGALALAVSVLLAGNIVAIKGIGGYHLSCAATDEAAVRDLRRRKHREAKPLAVLVADVDVAARLCEADEQELALLTSVARPIVLLRKREACAVADSVAPANARLGVMLPCSPLQHLLARMAGRPLVMTSGNRAGEPIAIDDAAALERLNGVADLFLTHDRAIASRCDDSVVRLVAGAPAFVRRARGYAPQPISLSRAVARPILGVGGHLKNTFCIARGKLAFVSQHVGDLAGPDAQRALAQGIAQYCRLFEVEPRVIAHDLHPDYHSTRLALELPAEQRIAVQHHHAHVAACAAEHGVTDPVLGVAFDGTGLGCDGAIWGGEFLIAEGGAFERVAHLSYVPLPGGDAAVRHPARMAAAHLFAACSSGLEALPIPFIETFAPGEWTLLRGMLERGVNAPPTSSVGRLFDAVAGLTGVCSTARFEGEAAMALEHIADPSEESAYRFELCETAQGWLAECTPVVRAVVSEVAAGCALATIAARFHNALRDLVVEVAARVRAQTGIRRVALTGGVFQNAFLLERTTAALDAHGFDVLLHRRVPCNDGGLGFGQVVVAAAVMEN